MPGIINSAMRPQPLNEDDEQLAKAQAGTDSAANDPSAGNPLARGNGPQVQGSLPGQATATLSSLQQAARSGASAPAQNANATQQADQTAQSDTTRLGSMMASASGAGTVGASGTAANANALQDADTAARDANLTATRGGGIISGAIQPTPSDMTNAGSGTGSNVNQTASTTPGNPAPSTAARAKSATTTTPATTQPQPADSTTPPKTGGNDITSALFAPPSLQTTVQSAQAAAAAAQNAQYGPPPATGGNDTAAAPGAPTPMKGAPGTTPPDGPLYQAAPHGNVVGDTATSGQTTAPGSTTSAGSGVPTSAAPAAAPASVSINPVTGQVTSDQTVQGQLKTILDSGSPLMEAARARAMQYASSRGLVNSAMAAQGGEEAMVNTATPIATADAGTFSRQALTNQDVQNQFLSQNKGIEAQTEAANADRSWQTGERAIDRAQQTKLTEEGYRSNESVAGIQASGQVGAASVNAAASMANTLADINAREHMTQEQIAASQQAQQNDINSRLNLAGLDATTRTNIANIDANTRITTNMAGLQGATLNNYATNVNTIQSNPDLSTEDKQTAIRNLNAIYGGSPYLPVSVNWNNTTTTPPTGGNSFARTPPGG